MISSLAKELNTLLYDSIAGRNLSEQGSSFFFPRGIVAQSAEAAQKASRYNATIGMACQDGEAVLTKSLGKLFPSLSPQESVAYAPTSGVPELRNTWNNLLEVKNPSLKGKSRLRPLVCSGICHAIMVALDLFIDPRDTLLLPSLFWGNYRLIIEQRRQASLETYSLFSPEQDFNIEALRTKLRSLSQRKAVILFNFPHNPTGYSLRTDEQTALTQMLCEVADEGKDIIAICDDAYFGFFFESDVAQESLFARLAHIHPRILAIKCDGVTKEEFAWGLRVGFLSMASSSLKEEHYGALEKKIMGIIRSSISSSSNLSQNLILRLLRDSEYASEKAQWFKAIEGRYRAVKSFLAQNHNSCLSPLPFNSGYFMTFHCRDISAEDLRQSLLAEGIGSIAIQDSFLRISFASINQEDIADLYQQIYDCAQNLLTR